MTEVRELKPSKFKKPKSYLIHDNGGRPFKVVIDEKSVDVYKVKYTKTVDEKGQEDEVATYPKVNKSFEYEGVFVGEDNSDFGLGNSILVHVSGNKYICIGWLVMEFETKEPIVTYVSRVGNSDVPYPYALSKNHCYFMLADDGKYWYVEKSIMYAEIDEAEDPYDYLYNDKKKYKTVNGKTQIVKGVTRPEECKRFKAKTLIKRIW